MRIRYFIGIVVFGLFNLVLTTALFAQTNDFTGPNGIKELQEKVYFEVLPTQPRSGDEVEITTEMYGTPIKNAQFTWFVNGAQMTKGIGMSTFSFVLEKKSTVKVIIVTGEGNTVERTWNFNPQNTVLIWEANTYTPPFYKGKSLYTPESTVVLNAINLDAKNPLTNTYANYIWEEDGEVNGDVSGVGKSVYVYQGNLLIIEPIFKVKTEGISAYRTNNPDAAIESAATLQIPTLSTEIFAYENTPLLGVLFNKQLSSSFLFNKEESGIVSYPVYFSLSSSLAGQYTWSINDEIVKRNSNSIAFKKTRNNEESRLSITIQNPKAFLQEKDISYIIDTNTSPQN